MRCYSGQVFEVGERKVPVKMEEEVIGPEKIRMVAEVCAAFTLMMDVAGSDPGVKRSVLVFCGECSKNLELSATRLIF